MHGDDRRARAGERQRVLEVRERGAEAAEQPRHPDGHPRDLAAGLELDRLDAFRDEVGPPGDGGEPEVRRAGELAQQRGDVGLVARPLPAEHVRVDDDQRGAHPAASR